MSLVIESACPERENPENEQCVADAPDDDTLSVGPDMPDLPLDAPPDPGISAPPVSTAEASPPEEAQTATEEAEALPKEEQGTVEEENAVNEAPPSAEPPLDQDEGNLAEEQGGNSGAREEQIQREMGEEEEQRAESTTQAEEGVEEKEVGEETQQKSESNDGVASVEAPTQGPITSQEPGEGTPHEVTEEGERSCIPCTCQSLFSNYNSHAPSRRKNRPCSLPVSELETVIASACCEPETPRSHYIRIHHLLHSLPSAQQRSQEEESGEGEYTSITQDTTSTSPTLKTSKEEGQDEEEEEEDTTQSPSQVQPGMNCRHG